MTDQRSLDALDVAQRFALGKATREELNAAEQAAWATAWVAAWAAADAAARAAQRAMFLRVVACETEQEAVDLLVAQMPKSDEGSSSCFSKGRSRNKNLEVSHVN
jgi:hypothetical protein